MTACTSLESIWTDCLACPSCHGGLRACRDARGQHLECLLCAQRYPVLEGIPSFVQAEGSEHASEIALRDEDAAGLDALYSAEENVLELPPLVRDLEPRPGDMVLDVGAGTGRVVREYLGRTRRVVAMDFSLGSLRHLRRRLRLTRDASDKLVLVHANACALPVRTGVFDRTLSIGMLHHLPRADLRERAVLEMARALRPGGRFVLQARHWSRAHAFHDARRGSPWARRVAGVLVGNGAGGKDLPRIDVYAGGAVSIYKSSAEEMRDLATRAGVRVERVVGRIQTIRGAHHLGLVRPLFERVLEATRLSLVAAQEVIAVGDRASAGGGLAVPST